MTGEGETEHSDNTPITRLHLTVKMVVFMAVSMMRRMLRLLLTSNVRNKKDATVQLHMPGVHMGVDEVLEAMQEAVAMQHMVSRMM
uniref:Uncharacterized protein n=1 Tax=Leersia perrieri TaxID=77586 RepID=A0A0D9WXU0_9ORYZ